MSVAEPVVTAEPTAKFAVHAIASGEVRDAEGNLLNIVTGEETYEVDGAELRAFSNDVLRGAGLTEEQITQVRNEGDQT